MSDKNYNCDTKTTDYLYRIGLFASMNHITVKALRFYEEQGLLYPAKTDEESGYRYYTMAQMESLQRILALKDAGFKIEDIKKLNTCEDEESLLRYKKNEIIAKIADLTLQLSKIEGYMAGGSSSLNYPVVIKRIPAVICASMQERIENYEDLFTVMPKMGELMAEAGCECAIPEYCFTHYLEPGYKSEDILIETCEAVTKKGKDTDRLKFKEFPETEVASVFHKGSYSSLSDAYTYIIKYIEVNQYEITGNIRENYIDGVWNKDEEEEWLTEIQIPVKKKI